MLSLAMTVPYTLTGKSTSNDDILIDRMFTPPNCQHTSETLSVYLIGSRGAVVWKRKNQDIRFMFTIGGLILSPFSSFLIIESYSDSFPDRYVRCWSHPASRKLSSELAPVHWSKSQHLGAFCNPELLLLGACRSGAAMPQHLEKIARVHASSVGAYEVSWYGSADMSSWITIYSCT